MKKWHMEGIVCATNNRQRRLVVLGRDRMYLARGEYGLVRKRKTQLVDRLRRFFSPVAQR